MASIRAQIRLRTITLIKVRMAASLTCSSVKAKSCCMVFKNSSIQQVMMMHIRPKKKIK
jgi:hypothetical protein